MIVPEVPLRTVFITNGAAAIRFSAPEQDSVLRCALEGIRSRYLEPSSVVPQILDLIVTKDSAYLKFGTAKLRVDLPQGPRAFAASVALPLLNIGSYVGGSTELFFEFLRQSCSATFHRLEDSAQLALPCSVATARAVLVTQFGNDLSSTRLEEIVRLLRREMPPNCEVLVATAELAHHPRQVLLTVVSRLRTLS